jgi:Cu+-exporting ATPase
VDTVVFDKTGTLTEGAPEVVAFEPAPGLDAARTLTLAASLERSSEHPLAQAVVRYHGGALSPAAFFEAFPGMGAAGEVDGSQVLIGRRDLLNARAIAVPGDDAQAARGRTMLYIAIDGSYAGRLAVADRPRASAAQAVRTLQAMGLKVMMLTGDQAATAQAVAGELGVAEVVAGVLPEGKLETIRRLRAGGAVVAMAGDGINDAPALAAADAGIALATGTDVASAAASVTLVRPDLDAIPEALRLARASVRVMRQNLFWAFFYNVIMIPAAALGYLNPILAAAAMSLSSVSVVANSLRLSRMKLK